MKRTYKNAFTLAELLIVMIVIGILVVLLLPSINLDDLNRKTNRAKAMKALRIFNEASIKIKGQSNLCPTGNFIERVPGNNGIYEYQYMLYKDADNPNNKTKADATDLITAYSNHIKFDKRLNLSIQSNSITGANLAGDNIFMGIRVYDSVKNCPDFLNPETGEEITIVEDNNIAPQCWGELYIDTNGEKSPNTIGEDVYIFGLDKDGVNLQSQRFH